MTVVHRIKRFFKPPWISGIELAGLLMQLGFAISLLGAILGYWFGGSHVALGTHAPTLAKSAIELTWAIAAVFAVVGIYRNFWFAYFLEAAVLAIAIAAGLVSSPNAGWDPIADRAGALDNVWPWWPTYRAIISWMCVCGVLVYLLRRGVQRLTESRTSES